MGSVVSEKQRATPVVVAPGCGHVGNRAAVIQALREQSVMSMPIRASLWISAGRNHLLSEEIDQQQGCVAFRAVTAQPDGAGKETAVWAAALADEAFTATRALVDRLRHDRPATLAFL